MAKTYDLRTYLTLEKALTRKLVKAWHIESADVYAAITQACVNQQWDLARRHVVNLDLTDVGTKHREWIKYLLRAIAVFGAGTIAKNKPSFVATGNFDTLLNQVTANFIQYLEYNATAQVQAEALQLIAEDEAKSKSVVQKAEHAFGNTQINLDPLSTAAQSLNAARWMIPAKDLAGGGVEESKGNHVTVRYGLENEDLDALRTFIAAQTPFMATLGEIEIFPASEHSDGACPVVVQILSPELHAIHAAIGKHADFKEESFPVYKPHCTLAYCKPTAAKKYQDLIVAGTFEVHSITISHQSGVMETIPFGMVKKGGPGSGRYPKGSGETQTKSADRDPVVAASSMDVLGRAVRVVKPKRARGDTLVSLNVEAFDAAFQKEGDFYIGPGGTHAIHDRYPRFGDFIATHNEMEVSEVTVNDDGKVGFTNGRHRYAWLRDHGVKNIPVAMTKESIRNAKKHGLLATTQKWDESKHPRIHGGSHAGEFTSGAADALDSLLNGEKVNIAKEDVRSFLKKATEQSEDPDLTDVHVEGMLIFGGNGLGIKREDMPQIPRDHRDSFLQTLKDQGVEVKEETVSPLDIFPTQNEISARTVGEKLEEYERKPEKKFPPLLVAKDSHVLDGHHHWGMMAALAVDVPDIKVPIYRIMISWQKALVLMHAYDKAHGIKRKTLNQKADKAGRFVTSFVSFDQMGNDKLQLIASLNASRMATWGFTAEAEFRGITRYRLTAILDGRTSKFCNFIDGKEFEVTDARAKVMEALAVQDPNDLRQVQPWPKQTKEAMAEFEDMSAEDLRARGLHIPPFHPNCRTMCINITGDKKNTLPLPFGEDITSSIPQSAAAFDAVGVQVTQAEVDTWNAHLGISPTEVLANLSGLTPDEVLAKDYLSGKAIQFAEDGSIDLNARGIANDVKYTIGSTLDPFTGIYYVNQAELAAGSAVAQAAFIKQMFMGLIKIGTQSSATSLAINVGSEAYAYAQLGFLPDSDAWSTIRLHALDSIDHGSLVEMFKSLPPAHQLLVRHLLYDLDEQALAALVDLKLFYQGKSIGAWILEATSGTFALDLTDLYAVEQAQAYLGA